MRPPDPHREGSLRRQVDRPEVAALVALTIGALVVVLRLAFAADGQVGSFVLVGSDHVLDRSQLPADLPITSGDGYDGQFYYRMAVQPTDLSLRDGDDAIALDLPLRRTRIGYPVLAWLTALGQPALVPAALVLVNLAAVGAAAAAGAVLAGAAGRHALWGLLPVGFPGLLTSLSRDLTELTAAALLLVGMAALARSRPTLAAAALSAAVLCRETALLLVAALAVTRVLDAVRHGRRTGRVDLAWLAPVAVFATWQVVVRVQYGSFPLLSSRGNAGVPGRAALAAATRWATDPTTERLAALTLLAGLLALVGLSLAGLSQARSAPERFVALALSVALAGSLSSFVWNDSVAQFRTFAEVHLFAAVCLLGARRHEVLPVAAAVTAALWLPMAVLHVRAL